MHAAGHSHLAAPDLWFFLPFFIPLAGPHFGGVQHSSSFGLGLSIFIGSFGLMQLLIIVAVSVGPMHDKRLFSPTATSCGISACGGAMDAQMF